MNKHRKEVRMISSHKQCEVSVSTFSNKPISSVLSAGADAEYVELDLTKLCLFSTKVSSKKAEH